MDAKLHSNLKLFYSYRKSVAQKNEACSKPSRKIIYHKKKDKPFIGTYLVTGTVKGKKKRKTIKGAVNLF